MLPKLALLWSLVVTVVVSGDVGDEVEVVVSGGTVRGISKTSMNGREYYAFQAIPYAQPPLFRQRFMPPQPDVTWEGVHDGTKPGEACAQAALGVVKGVEDCINLYVYTPKVPKEGENANLPVVVWLHGGAFVLGEASALDERLLMDRDIVLVIPQYRLGILGYFQTLLGRSPGNMGALDQVEALKWVQNNIHVFGGNPNQVTLAGDCAGAASTIYHMISPLSEGLFHRVISLSGAPLNPWAFYTNNHRFMLILARYIKCPAYDPAVLIQCLQELPQEELLDGAQLVMEARDLLVGNHRLGPSLQIPADTHITTLFLDEHPLQALTEGHVHKVPVLMSVTRDVGSYLVDMMLYDFFLYKLEENENFLPEALPMLLKECLIPKHNDHVQEFRDYYFPGIKFDNLKEILPGMAQMLGDLHYNAGILNTATLLSQHVPVQFLRYEFEGGPNLFNIRHPNISSAPPMPFSVGHGDEMALILPDMNFGDYTEEQKKVSKDLIDIIENFAYGRPAKKDWPLFTTDSQEALIMEGDGSFTTGVFASSHKTQMLNKINSYIHHKIIEEMEGANTEGHDEL